MNTTQSTTTRPTTRPSTRPGGTLSAAPPTPATWFNVEVELDAFSALLDDELNDALLQALHGFHPVLSTPNGLLAVRVSLPAAGLIQAGTTAITLIERVAAEAGLAAPAVSVTAMTETEFNNREGFTEPARSSADHDGDEPSGTVSTFEAAEILQMTRQAVVKRAQLPATHPDHLPATRDRRGRWSFHLLEVRRAAARRGATLIPEVAATDS